jgi:phosphoribosylcarboxyaminoimidazole (NCAIR) mutase
LLKGLNKEQVAYLLTIKSAYRTPQAMIDSARAFPEVLMSSNDPTVSDQTTHEMLKVKFCIAIAGWSAHIAGMTASETSTPVIALPAESSA